VAGAVVEIGVDDAMLAVSVGGTTVAGTAVGDRTIAVGVAGTAVGGTASDVGVGGAAVGTGTGGAGAAQARRLTRRKPENTRSTTDRCMR